MQEQKNEHRVLSPSFISISIVNFLLMMGEFLSNAIVPLYANHLGSSAFIVGFVSTVFAVTALAIRPVSGPALDCFVKKKLLIATGVITALAFVIYGVSKNVPVLIIGRLIHGIGIGVSAPVTLAIAGACLPKEKLASGISIFMVSTAIANAVGPGIGLYLAEVLGFQMVFFISAGLTMIAIILAFFVSMPGFQEQKRFVIRRDNIFERKAMIPALITACIAISQSCVGTYIAIYGAARGVAQIGLFFTANAIALILSRPFVGTLTDKYGYKASMIPGFICCVASYVIISFSDSLMKFIFAGMIYGLGFGTTGPVIQALSLKRVGTARHGVAANTIYAGMDLGYLLGGPISGFVCVRLQGIYGDAIMGYSGTFLVMTIPIALGLAMFLVDMRKNES